MATNCIHVEGGTNRSSAGIGQQQSCYTAADEDDLIEQRMELSYGGNETREIWIPRINIHVSQCSLGINSRG